MGYVLYHADSTRLIGRYATARGAKIGLCAANKNANNLPVSEGLSYAPYAIAEETYYNDFIVYSKTVKNLLTGNAVEIKSNTPLCCDPSSELYHSM